MSRFNSWVAGAMGVKFLAQGSNSSRKPRPDIEPGTYDYQADAHVFSHHISVSNLI